MVCILLLLALPIFRPALVAFLLELTNLPSNLHILYNNKHANAQPRVSYFSFQKVTCDDAQLFSTLPDA